MEQLSPCATTTEPARLEPVLRNGRGRDSERPVHRDEEWPLLAATRESPRTETKIQHSQKLKKKKDGFKTVERISIISFALVLPPLLGRGLKDGSHITSVGPLLIIVGVCSDLSRGYLEN